MAEIQVFLWNTYLRFWKVSKVPFLVSDASDSAAKRAGVGCNIGTEKNVHPGFYTAPTMIDHQTLYFLLIIFNERLLTEGDIEFQHPCIRGILLSNTPPAMKYLF